MAADLDDFLLGQAVCARALTELTTVGGLFGQIDVVLQVALHLVRPVTLQFLLQRARLLVVIGDHVDDVLIDQVEEDILLNRQVEGVLAQLVRHVLADKEVAAVR